MSLRRWLPGLRQSMVIRIGRVAVSVRTRISQRWEPRCRPTRAHVDSQLSLGIRPTVAGVESGRRLSSSSLFWFREARVVAPTLKFDPMEIVTRRVHTGRILGEQGRLQGLVPADEPTQLEPYPLPDVQQAYWIGRSGEFGLGGIACHGYLEVDVTDLDVDRLERACAALIRRHPCCERSCNPTAGNGCCPRSGRTASGPRAWPTTPTRWPASGMRCRTRSWLPNSGPCSISGSRGARAGGPGYTSASTSSSPTPAVSRSSRPNCWRCIRIRTAHCRTCG